MESKEKIRRAIKENLRRVTLGIKMDSNTSTVDVWLMSK